MGDQEIDYLQKLHLSTVCDHHHPASASATATARNSAKRPRSPVSKMATLYPPFSSSADQDFHGFNRIPLPENFTAASPPPLRRTLSEPIPVFNQQIAATPPRPPRSRNPSRSPNCGESPSSKRLKKMKERMKQMRNWWDQVASVDDEDEKEENFDSETVCTHQDSKEQCEEEDVDNNPSQEAVFVEKNGECAVLHFQCPCGNGYQILLSGNSCYYKLTNYRSC